MLINFQQFVEANTSNESCASANARSRLSGKLKHLKCPICTSSHFDCIYLLHISSHLCPLILLHWWSFQLWHLPQLFLWYTYCMYKFHVRTDVLISYDWLWLVAYDWLRLVVTGLPSSVTDCDWSLSVRSQLLSIHITDVVISWVVVTGLWP